MLLGKGESRGLLSSEEALGVGREHRRGKEHQWGVVRGLCLWFFVVFLGVFLASWYTEVMLKFNESLMLKQDLGTAVVK